MSSRWLALIIFIIIVGIIAVYDKHTWSERIKHYGMAFLEGMVGGLIVDTIGVNASYYYFPRQPLYSLDYWLVVIPCWGVFGLALNFLWSYVAKGRFIRGSLVTIPSLFVWYEGTNLLMHSWVYTVPTYVVILGWIPLVYVFSGCDHRREVVFKMDSWMEQTENPYIQLGLRIVRYALILVMFPLLIASIRRALRDFLKQDNVSLKAYTLKYLMLRSG